jgi:hypothetical protein
MNHYIKLINLKAEPHKRHGEVYLLYEGVDVISVYATLWKKSPV